MLSLAPTISMRRVVPRSSRSFVLASISAMPVTGTTTSVTPEAAISPISKSGAVAVAEGGARGVSGWRRP